MVLCKVPAGIYISPAKAAPVPLPGSVKTSDPSLAVHGPWAGGDSDSFPPQAV